MEVHIIAASAIDLRVTRMCPTYFVGRQPRQLTAESLLFAHLYCTPSLYLYTA